MDKKVAELQRLKEAMEADNSLPLKKGATNLVFGVGNADTEMLLIGEGPGYFEDKSGEPFVGQAGKLLNNLLSSINIKREEVYITNVVHHRPPENRDPLPEEISAYGNYLDKIIEIINPKIILTLGRFSMGKFLPFVKISAVHGKPHKVKWGANEYLVVPMYHPAASLRNGEVLRQEKEDFLKLPKIISELKEAEQLEKKKVEQMELI